MKKLYRCFEDKQIYIYVYMIYEHISYTRCFKMVPPPCQACQRALWWYQQWYWRCFLPSSRLPPAWWDIVSGWTTFRNVLWLCMPQNGPLLQNNLKKHCLCRSTWKVIVSREHVWLYFCVAFSIYYSMPPQTTKAKSPLTVRRFAKSRVHPLPSNFG